MRTRAVATVLVALLAVLAGCGGMTGGETTTAPTTTTPGASTTTTTTTTTAAPTPDEGFPTGYNETGPLKDRSVLSTHYQTLNETSYTEEFRFLNNEETSGSVAMDTEDRTTQFTLRREGQPTVNIYVDNDTFYRQVLIPGNTSYASVDNGFFQTRVSIEQFPAATLSTYTDANYSFVGTTEADGVTLYEYDVTGIDRTQRGAPSPSQVSDLDGTLVVDENGVIREYRLTATVQGQEGSYPVAYEYTLTNLGSTTNEEPGWVDRVRNAES